MDGPSRARIVLGTVAVLVAVLASLALLNVLLEEPLPLGDDNGNEGGPSGGNPIPTAPSDPGTPTESGGQEGRSQDPCKRIEPPAKVVALTSTVIAMGLWVLAVWWRQKRQTRVMNGWAIGALLVTLLAVTALFAWWIIHKVCSLDVFDLNSCLEIAHSLRGAFFFFLVMAAGLIGFSVLRAKRGQKFWSLYSIAGFVFVYLAILALVGWLVAEDMCDRQFKEPDLDDIKPPDNGDPGDPGSPSPPSTPPSNPGGNTGFGGGQGGGGGGGGGGAVPALPQVSPFALLVILGIAALVTVLVLAVKGRQDQQRAMAMAALDAGGRAGMIRLFMDTDLDSNDGVVATYRRFLDQATLTGAAKKPHETPREHARRACKTMSLPFEEVEPLVDAYLHVRLAEGALPEERRTLAMSLARLIRPTASVSARRRRKR